MPANTKPAAGGHKDLSSILASATNVGCAISFALRGVLSSKQMGISKLVYFTVRDVVSVPRSARKV